MSRAFHLYRCWISSTTDNGPSGTWLECILPLQKKSHAERRRLPHCQLITRMPFSCPLSHFRQTVNFRGRPVKQKEQQSSGCFATVCMVGSLPIAPRTSAWIPEAACFKQFLPLTSSPAPPLPPTSALNLPITSFECQWQARCWKRCNLSSCGCC